jgi:hypothetical protein
VNDQLRYIAFTLLQRLQHVTEDGLIENLVVCQLAWPEERDLRTIFHGNLCNLIILC